VKKRGKGKTTIPGTHFSLREGENPLLSVVSADNRGGGITKKRGREDCFVTRTVERLHLKKRKKGVEKRRAGG